MKDYIANSIVLIFPSEEKGFWYRPGETAVISTRGALNNKLRRLKDEAIYHNILETPAEPVQTG